MFDDFDNDFMPGGQDELDPGFENIDPMTGLPYNYRGPSDNYMYGAGISPEELTALGFSQDEVTILVNAQGFYGKLSQQKLAMPPFGVTNPIINARIMYAYNLCMGRTIVDINSIKSIEAHYKKLARISGLFPDFNCADFNVRKEITTVPRTAVVSGLPFGNFYVLNSGQYEMLDRSYKVVKIAKEWVTIESERKMSVGPEDRLTKSVRDRQWGIPDVLVVEEVGNKLDFKPWVLRIHKRYCRLCNRFLVVISKNIDEYSKNNCLFGYRFVLSNGVTLYLYARMNKYDVYGNPTDEKVENPNHNKHVIDYGYYGDEIESKVTNAMNKVTEAAGHNGLQMVYSEPLEITAKFKMASPYEGMERVDNGDDSFEQSELDIIEDDI